MSNNLKYLLLPSILVLFLSLYLFHVSWNVQDAQSPVATLTPSSGQVGANNQPGDQFNQHETATTIKPKETKLPTGKKEQDEETFLTRLKSKVLNDVVPISNGLLNISSIDTFNNVKLSPMLQSIVAMDYFRFVKLNLKKTCTLWPDDTKCAERDCTIRFCDESDLPASIVSEENLEVKNGHKKTNDNECSDGDLSEINETISSEHEETMDSLFECSDQEDGQYIDLLLNPERYTGYRGESAHRIWNSIYQENCFFKHQKMMMNNNPFFMDNLCFEEKIFYRSISGLHSSINIHLTSLYPTMRGSSTFTFNLKEFLKRFEHHQDYIVNLYFVYLLELRALVQMEPILMTRINWQSSSDGGSSITTRDAIKSLLKVVKSFKWSFDESTFVNQPLVNQHEFGEHFKNITNNIMDCVGCEKCKLWGKVQIRALGTTFKVLLHDPGDYDSLHISRHEISSLINSIAKLSRSIQFLEEFNKLLIKSKQINPPNGKVNGQAHHHHPGLQTGKMNSNQAAHLHS